MPQVVVKNLKTVCVMKFEHLKFYEHPIKYG